MEPRRFNDLASYYEEHLKDSVRDGFSGQQSQFFHARKRDLIRAYLTKHSAERGNELKQTRWLDVGCGKGDLLQLLRGDFASAAGCDVSAEMMRAVAGVQTRVQTVATSLPFDNGEFDFVTAVCVYHHVPVDQRAALTAEVARVLRPGGTVCVIEHNPLNPVTRGIVRRTLIDVDAILLRASETRDHMSAAGFHQIKLQYFLFFPQPLYSSMGWIEPGLSWLPLGGQYAAFGRRLTL
jgi:SAM-dependent methyltransferase